MTVSSCLYNIYECVSIYSCFLSKHRLQKYKYFKLEHFLQGQTPPPAHTTESKILNLIKATRQSMTSWKPNKTKIRFDISSFLFQILVKWAVKFQSRWGFFFFGIALWNLLATHFTETKHTACLFLKWLWFTLSSRRVCSPTLSHPLNVQVFMSRSAALCYFWPSRLVGFDYWQAPVSHSLCIHICSLLLSPFLLASIQNLPFAHSVLGASIDVKVSTGHSRTETEGDERQTV